MHRLLIISALILLSVSSSARAVDVTFSGTLSTACTLAIPLTGQLGVDANGDLTSQAGRTANLSVLSVGSNRLVVAAPAWSAATPGGYVASGEQLWVKYAGISGYTFQAQDWTTAQTTLNLSSIPVTLIGVDAKATNPNGFVPGTYNMKVTVTCAP